MKISIQAGLLLGLVLLMLMTSSAVGQVKDKTAGSKPEDKPDGKPEDKPEGKPEDKPNRRPGSKPNRRPWGKPGKKPEPLMCHAESKLEDASQLRCCKVCADVTTVGGNAYACKKMPSKEDIKKAGKEGFLKMVAFMKSLKEKKCCESPKKEDGDKDAKDVEKPTLCSLKGDKAPVLITCNGQSEEGNLKCRPMFGRFRGRPLGGKGGKTGGPSKTCKNIRCPKMKQCEMVAVNCVKAPCPAMPTCVSIKPEGKPDGKKEGKKPEPLMCHAESKLEDDSQVICCKVCADVTTVGGNAYACKKMPSKEDIKKAGKEGFLKRVAFIKSLKEKKCCEPLKKQDGDKDAKDVGKPTLCSLKGDKAPVLIACNGQSEEGNLKCRPMFGRLGGRPMGGKKGGKSGGKDSKNDDDDDIKKGKKKVVRKIWHGMKKGKFAKRNQGKGKGVKNATGRKPSARGNRGKKDRRRG